MNLTKYLERLAPDQRLQSAKHKSRHRQITLLILLVAAVLSVYIERGLFPEADIVYPDQSFNYIFALNHYSADMDEQLFLDSQDKDIQKINFDQTQPIHFDGKSFQALAKHLHYLKTYDIALNNIDVIGQITKQDINAILDEQNLRTDVRELFRVHLEAIDKDTEEMNGYAKDLTRLFTEDKQLNDRLAELARRPIKSSFDLKRDEEKIRLISDLYSKPGFLLRNADKSLEFADALTSDIRKALIDYKALTEATNKTNATIRSWKNVLLILVAFLTATVTYIRERDQGNLSKTERPDDSNDNWYAV